MGWDGSELREITKPDLAQRLKEQEPAMVFSEGEEVTVKGVVFTISSIDPPRIVLKAKETAARDALVASAQRVKEALDTQ